MAQKAKKNGANEFPWALPTDRKLALDRESFEKTAESVHRHYEMWRNKEGTDEKVCTFAPFEYCVGITRA